MTEREFREWQIRGELWPRKMEVMFAQLTAVLAQVNSNNRSLDDFDLFKHRPDVKPVQNTEQSAALIGAMAGVGFRKLSQGRKKKDMQ